MALLVAMAGAGAPAFAQSPPSSMSGPEISVLIRSTLVALDQANLTGNYTVLRDLGANAACSDLAADPADRLQPALDTARRIWRAIGAAFW